MSDQPEAPKEFEIIQLSRAVLRLWDENKIRPTSGHDVMLDNMAFEELRAELERYDHNQNKPKENQP